MFSHVILTRHALVRKVLATCLFVSVLDIPSAAVDSDCWEKRLHSIGVCVFLLGSRIVRAGYRIV
jgi:hypothetical protein